jgi:hypothetical protein
MRLQTPVWLVGGLALLLSAGGAAGQGNFQNLGFESASLVPIPGDSYGRVQFAAAFPGWTGLVGGTQETGALYNNEFLDSSGISIIDQGWSDPFGGTGGLIQGNFTIILQAGVVGSIANTADTTLSQTGLVPSAAQSLQFAAYLVGNPPLVVLAVTLGGQRLSLTPLASGGNYTLYGADIHAWAGQTAELAFTLRAEQPHIDNRYLFLDAIQFSNLPTPEPSVFGLSALGALLLRGRVLARRR